MVSAAMQPVFTQGMHLKSSMASLAPGKKT
jgi:hypothetical protein